MSGLPDGAADDVDIQDRYVVGTTLRLRRMRAGADTAYKLGQKVRVDAGSPERVALTNLYLTLEEFELLAQLEAAPLHKVRHWWPVGGRELGVDEFRGSLEGLVLAEVELRADEALLPAPPLAVADVTQDDRFSGGRLARLSPEGAAALLADVAALVRQNDPR